MLYDILPSLLFDAGPSHCASTSASIVVTKPDAELWHKRIGKIPVELYNKCPS